MALTRPTTDFKNKTNINPVQNRPTEATAEDFQEAGALFDEYADAIEALQNDQSPNPFYGRHTSLGALQAAFPTGELNAWAIIDAGAGITPVIAAWDDIGAEWELAAATLDPIFVANQGDLPNPGEANRFYITLDNFNLWVYQGGSWAELGRTNQDSWRTLSLKEKQTTAIVDTGANGFSLRYSGSDITEIIFGPTISKYIDAIEDQFADLDLIVRAVNETSGAQHIFYPHAIAWTDGTNVYKKMEVIAGVDPADFTVLDKCYFYFDLVKIQKKLIQGLWFDTYGNTNRYEIEAGNKFEGWPAADRYVVGKVVSVPFTVSTDLDDEAKSLLAIDNYTDS